MDNNLARNIKSIFEEKYVIPLYQRNFTWGKDEIEQLFQDIYDSFDTNKDSRYYIGTLVVIPRRNEHVFEVIDGQQRITVLSLISKLFGIVDAPVLKYDSRPEVEEFLRDFYSIKKTDIEKDLNAFYRDIPQTENLRAALSYIRKVEVFAKNNDNSEKITLFESEKLEAFKKYFSENVILIFEEMPDDTDVAAYFEIMNNRGEQLQKHEILKAKFISQIDEKDSLKNRKSELFAAVWDACSRMDVPVQRFFGSEARKDLFGEGFDGVNFNWECLLNENYNIKKNYDKNIVDDDDDSEFGSIIDFPNFLMHVLKIYGIKSQDNNDITIPLNEKNMPTDGKVGDPLEFAKALLFFRVVFDRFIIKTSSKESEDPQWVLYSTYKQIYTDKNGKDKASLRVNRATFGDSYRKIFNGSKQLEREEKDLQNRIVKALSMLQVTFRQRINKNWLQELLKWFWDKRQNWSCNEYTNLNLVAATDYLNKIETFMRNYFDKIIVEKEEVFEKDTWEFKVAKGEKTPHFLFNFIDYLYWVDIVFNNREREIYDDLKIKTDSKFSSKTGSDVYDEKQIIYSDFSFKYYNSVEHHYPQHPENGENMDSKSLENLGNLYLISKNINSKMSNQLPVAKMEYKAENPNRRIMYFLTNQKGWNRKVIQGHYNDLVKLLQERDTILVGKANVSSMVE